MTDLHAAPPSDASSLSRRRWMPWLVFSLLIVVGIGLRVHRLDQYSFWQDEFYALELSTGQGFEEATFPLNAATPIHTDLAYTQPDGIRPIAIWQKQVVDSHPPLHFIALGIWRSMFGSGEAAARSLSVVFSVYLLFAIGSAVREQSGWTPALWAAAILAISGVQIGYAQEARNYAMLLAILYSLAWFVLRAQRIQAISLPAAAGMAVLMYCAVVTHYLSIGPLIAIGLYGVFALRGAARWRFIGAAAIAGVVCGITWGPFLLQQAHNDIGAKMRWIGVDPTHGPVDVVKRLAIWSWNSLAIDESTPWRVRYFSALALIVPTVVSVWDRRLRLWVALFWGALLNVTLMDLAEHTDRLRITRYTLAAGPALCVAVILAADRSKWTRHAIPALLVVVCLTRLGSAYALRNVDWRPLAAYIDSLKLEARDVVVVTGSAKSPWESQVYLLGLGHYTHWSSPDAIPPFAILTTTPAPTMLDAMDIAHRTIVIQSAKSTVDRVLPRANLRPLTSLPDLADVYEWTRAPMPTSAPVLP